MARGVLAVAAVVVAGARAVWAFQDPQGASNFVPMDQLARQDSVPGGTLVVVAYAVVWVVVTAYLLTLWRRAARIERELADVNARLAAGRRSN
jgi:CcmD family protein